MSEEKEKRKVVMSLDEIEDPIELGPRIISPEEWVDDWKTGVEAKARKWKQRAMRPKKDPIKAGIDAEEKYADKVKRAAELGLRAKALAKWTFEDWGKTIELTPEGDYSAGATKKAYKMRRKIDAMYDARVYAAQKLDLMPTATDADRDRKVTANLHIMRKLKEFMAGIITLEDFKRFVDEETGV